MRGASLLSTVPVLGFALAPLALGAACSSEPVFGDAGYWRGTDDYLDFSSEQASFLGLDGEQGAPAAGTVRAAWREGGSIFLIAP